MRKTRREKSGLALGAVVLVMAALVFLGGRTASADSLFSATITAPAFPGQTYTINFNAAEELDNQITTETIQTHIPGFTDNHEARAVINFRGLPINLRFGANGSTLYMTIPSIGVSETFAAGSRGASIDMLEDWFKKDGGEALSRMQKELIKVSPADPIAGNPTSLQSNMVTSAYDRGFTSTTTQIAPTPAADQKAVQNANLIGLGARFGSLRASGLDGSYYSFPLAYSFRWTEDPRQMLTISVPISIVEVEEAKSYSIGLGLALTWPINKQWAITPAFQYGFVGSVDLGSVSQMVSGSLTSAYTWDLKDGYKLSMGNMIGYYKTLEFEYQGYKFDPDIQNTIFRNGLMVSIPAEKIYPNTVVEVFVIDTRFFGSDLYLDSYEEVGFAFGFNKFSSKELPEKIVNTIRSFRVGLSYLWGDGDNNVATLNFGFAF